MKLIYFLSITISLTVWMLIGFRIMLDTAFWEKEKYNPVLVFSDNIILNIAFISLLIVFPANLLVDYYLVKLLFSKVN